MESLLSLNSTTTISLHNTGLLVSFINSLPSSLVVILITLLCLALALYFILLLQSPVQDEREPPLFKPLVPFIGHFFSLMKEQTSFLPNLKRLNMPIATLPILTGKIYAVWDADLIQAVYRNKNISYDPILVENAQGALGLDKKTYEIILNEELVHEFSEAIHKGMITSEVQRMNTNALKYVSVALDDLKANNKVVIPNLWYWLRDLMTTAACQALFGPENPISEPQLISDIWTWDDYLIPLVLNIFPSLTAKKGYHARNRLQIALNKYYSGHGHLHHDTAAITKGRAAVLHRYGIEYGTIGTIEISLLHAATINTIPVLFWLLAFTITRPDVLERIRAEVSAVPVHATENTATVNMDSVAEQCPLLLSAYKETLRLCDSAQVPRRVVSETTVSDSKGQTYLLKKGMDVQLPSEHLHKMESVWGSNAREFQAERFLQPTEKAVAKDARTRRISYNPFGGGKHICPGRNFAQAEILGFFISFILSYNIMPLDNKWDEFKEPKMGKPLMTTPVSMPLNFGDGFGIKIKRRAGWENTTWEITSGK